MKKPSDQRHLLSRRAVISGGLSMLGAAGLHLSGAVPATQASAELPTTERDAPPRNRPDHYNVLFILVDQEHFFDKWPMPVPAREWLKKNGVTFTNHQAAACVCSSARSTIYTGQHIQHTGVFDNAGIIWQPDMSNGVLTIGHHMASTGYHAAYQGKWHLSGSLDQVQHAIDAPFADYRKIIASYGFDDFFGVGDIDDRTLGGYSYDETTTAFAVHWLRTRGEELRAAGKPWYLAVNFVNPHDVMYIDSDLPGEVVQGRANVMPIAPPPQNKLYSDAWVDVPLPESRKQPFDAPGRPPAHKVYQDAMNVLVGEWPNEDRRWRVLRDYYYNCIRDCDQQVARLLESLRSNGMDRDTIIVFTADHGELGGNHQMRGKGTCAYHQQNHLPLIVVHPDVPGGQTCQAITSQVDLAPTLLELAGGEGAVTRAAAAGLKGRSFARLLESPGSAAVNSLRPASLFNFDMLLFQDAKWARRVDALMMDAKVPRATRFGELEKMPPDFHNRCSIRSVFDGRYRFSRYFSPLDFNTPNNFDTLTAKNDIELYDLHEDPEEMTSLAASPKARDLLMAMNDKLNARIAEEVGEDNGAFLPIRNGKWYFA